MSYAQLDCHPFYITISQTIVAGWLKQERVLFVHTCDKIFTTSGTIFCLTVLYKTLIL